MPEFHKMAGPKGRGEILERDISLTFAKGMAVLRAFDSGQTHMTLPQIARATGFDRAITRRLVLTLVHLGYVKQEDRLFSLTPRILVLAGGFLQARRFGKTIEPVIQSFSNQISEAISMAMIDGTQAVYVAHARDRVGTMSIGFTVGSKVPLLTTAIGRALVAASPPDLAEDLIRNAPLEAHTPQTDLDRDRIAADIALSARRGHAFVDGQFEPGVAALAVPVYAQGAEPSALGMSGDAARFADPEYTRRVIESLRNCAKVVAELL